MVVVLTPRDVQRDSRERECVLLTLEGIEAIVSRTKDSNNKFTNRKEKKMQESYMQEEKLSYRNGAIENKMLAVQA